MGRHTLRKHDAAQQPVELHVTHELVEPFLPVRRPDDAPVQEAREHLPRERCLPAQQPTPLGQLLPQLALDGLRIEPG